MSGGALLLEAGPHLCGCLNVDQSLTVRSEVGADDLWGVYRRFYNSTRVW